MGIYNINNVYKTLNRGTTNKAEIIVKSVLQMWLGLTEMQHRDPS